MKRLVPGGRWNIILLALIASLLIGPWAFRFADDQGVLSFGLPGSLAQDDFAVFSGSYSAVPSGTNPGIQSRSSDSRPLTKREIFGGAGRRLEPTKSGDSLTLEGLRSDKNCSSAFWGDDVRQLLHRSKCSQVVRGEYGDSSGTLVVNVAIVNLQDQEWTTKLNSDLTRSSLGFIRPLRRERHYSPANERSAAIGEAIGHYLFIVWASEPRGSAADLRSYLTIPGNARRVLERRGDESTTDFSALLPPMAGVALIIVFCIARTTGRGSSNQTPNRPPEDSID
ncbi:hypothetical protein [Actinomadura montaniterrae]|uniref:Uncharacterized protein n=1 Tax=Actinomadura montaniterrae TaxID=1803903 RepID=A0A6L3VQ95_9ACTN|nr:hypothetical protein [Actinomadura montaniterrae]KAB2373324.1 hypothetical protein F9B16_28775 [Actinomadura montaniterrae]